MTDLMYLHGFASAPGGSKGAFCRRWAEARGIPFQAPDLNLPTFEGLTLSAQVDAVAALVARAPAPPVLVGSSLGGWVAVAVLQRALAVRRLILLAPAFGFAERRLAGEQWQGYRERGYQEVFHFASNRPRMLGPELLSDLPRWADESSWRMPDGTEILHGRRDESVPLSESQAMAARNPGVVLHILDDDHALLAPPTLDLLAGCLLRAFEPLPGVVTP